VGSERLVVVGDAICDVPAFHDAMPCSAGIWTAPIDEPSALEAIPASDELFVGNAHPIVGQRPGTVDIAAGPNGFVAIGYRGMTSSPIEATIWWSADGLVWQVAEVGDTLSAASLAAVVAGGPGYVVVGSVHDPAAPRAAAWGSPDGRSWQRVPDTDAFAVGGYINTGEIPVAGGMTSVARHLGGFVAFGSRCVGGGTLAQPGPMGGPDSCGVASWTSEDGISWRQNDLALEPGAAVSSVGVTDGRVVAVGSAGFEAAGQPSVGMSLVSRDGTTWEAVALEGLPRLDVAVAVPGGVIAFGSEGGRISAWVSAEGVEWEEISSLPQIGGAVVIRDLDAAIVGDKVVLVGWAEVRGSDPVLSFALVGSAFPRPR